MDSLTALTQTAPFHILSHPGHPSLGIPFDALTLFCPGSRSVAEA
jgi:hypothetical protein